MFIDLTSVSQRIAAIAVKILNGALFNGMQTNPNKCTTHTKEKYCKQ